MVFFQLRFYHERFKEKYNERYLKDARERHKRNYICLQNMDRTETEKRCAAVRECVGMSRTAAKERRNTGNNK